MHRFTGQVKLTSHGDMHPYLVSYMDIIKTPPLSVLKNKLSQITEADVPFTKRP